MEITYETNETEESDTSQESSSPLPHQQRPRKNSKKIKQQPVPFPEHGVDIVDSPEELDEEEPSKKITQVLAWEQNWLFKRKKKPILFSKMAAESVPMLVPNPSSTSEEHDLIDDDDEEDRMSDIEDEDFNGGYFEFPEGHKTESNNNNININISNEAENEDDEPPPPPVHIKWPQDVVDIAAGKTARISVTVPDSEREYHSD